MAIETLIVNIVTIVGVFGVICLALSPLAWWLLKRRIKKIQNKIPEKIKKEVENVKDKRKTEQRLSRERYKELDSTRDAEWRERIYNGTNGETERIRREIGSLKPADSNVPRITRTEIRRSVQVQPDTTTPEVKQKHKRNWPEFS